MKRHYFLGILSIVFIVIFIFLYALMPKISVSIENIIKDNMFIYRGEVKSDDRIVIVDIDERSLGEISQWPWSRDVVAKILTNLANNGVAAIGLDIVFAEEDNSSPSKVFEKIGLKTEAKAINYDDELARAFKSTPTISGFFFSFKDEHLKSDKEPRVKAIIIEKNKPKDDFLPIANRAILNINKLEKNSFSSGFLNNIPDNDGIIRNVPSVIKYKDILYPSLTIEMIRLLTNQKKIIINYEANGITHINIGKIKIPTDISGFIRVNYTGSTPKYKYISATDVYNDKFDKSLVENKIVLFGTSAAGLHDIRSSPFEASYPGVETHANLLDNIINKSFISKPQWSMSVDVATLILMPIFCFFILFFARAFLSFLLIVLLVFVILSLHFYLMFQEGFILNSFFPLMQVLSIFVVGIIINFIYEARQKDFIKSKFANKVSKSVMDEILEQKSNVNLIGETKEISIFFSDIRNFTTISESMRPEELISYLNSYITPMVEIITKNQGTVDKFIGDAIMAYWNAPKQVKNHADLALVSAIEQINKLEELNVTLKEQNLPNINIGIGLNSGHCVVGEMGSKGRSDYTCIGDAVNLASRLEGLNKKYETNIIISEFFLQKLKNPEIYQLEELGFEKVKGKNIEVKIYKCLGFKAE